MSNKIHLNTADSDEYEVTDSEEEYSEEEREILAEVRKGRRRDQDETEELLRFDDSESEDEDDDGDGDSNGDDLQNLMADSDIESGKGDNDDDQDDPREWGTKARNYYGTDFVDPDFSTYTEKERELAELEEEEAKAIQLRLAKDMKETDFVLEYMDSYKVSEPTQDTDAAKSVVKVSADFSNMSKRDKRILFQKDSPEFAGLIGDFQKYLKESETLLTPVLAYVHENNVPMIPAFVFTQQYRNLVQSYCSNISFYLLLKANRANIKAHPAMERIMQFKKLIDELRDRYENIIKPQLEALLERIEDGDVIEVLTERPATAETERKPKKNRLAILDEYENRTGKAVIGRSVSEAVPLGSVENDTSSESDEDDDERTDNDEADTADPRRSITYQIAKNKGLRTHRKKEQRNPRVKHRNKFRKALIRRKGAVRTVRKETSRYSGEVSGIKSTVSKSIKFKV